MKCVQCGAIIYDGLKFCMQCGARAEIRGNKIEVDQDTAPVPIIDDDMIKQYRKHKLEEEKKIAPKTEEIEWQNNTIAQPVAQSVQAYKNKKEDIRQKTERKSSRRLQGAKKEKVKSAVEKSKSYLTKENIPYLNFEVYERKKKVANREWEDQQIYFYMGLLIFVNAFISTLGVRLGMSKLADTIDMAVYLISNLTGQVNKLYSTGSVGIKFFFVYILVMLIVVGLFIGNFYGLNKYVLKERMKLQECIECILMPLGIFVVGKVIVIGLIFININLGILGYIILFSTVSLMTILQFINRFKQELASIYFLPAMYSLSVVVAVWLGIKILW